MDLPTTDPGSDLCDYIDSADEARPERKTIPLECDKYKLKVLKRITFRFLGENS